MYLSDCVQKSSLPKTKKIQETLENECLNSFVGLWWMQAELERRSGNVSVIPQDYMSTMAMTIGEES